MALAAGTIERHRERQRMDRLGTPTQIATPVPLIVYSASNFAGAKKFRLKIEVRASNGQQTSDSFRSLRSIVSRLLPQRSTAALAALPAVSLVPTRSIRISNFYFVIST